MYIRNQEYIKYNNNGNTNIIEIKSRMKHMHAEKETTRTTFLANVHDNIDNTHCYDDNCIKIIKGKHIACSLVSFSVLSLRQSNSILLYNITVRLSLFSCLLLLAHVDIHTYIRSQQNF